MVEQGGAVAFALLRWIGPDERQVPMRLLWVKAAHRFQHGENNILITSSGNRLLDQSYELLLIGLNPRRDPKRGCGTVN